MAVAFWHSGFWEYLFYFLSKRIVFLEMPNARMPLPPKNMPFFGIFRFLTEN
jgi:hypothetical protein